MKHHMWLLLLLIWLLAACTSAVTERAIDEKVTVKASVDDVWKAWTTSAGIKTFFAPDANVELRVDGPFQIFMNPLAEPGLRGADDMKIIGFQDKKMLSFTWNAPPSLPEARKQRTIVIVRFVARGDSLTDVSIHHIGWGSGSVGGGVGGSAGVSGSSEGNDGEWDKAFDYFGKAWPKVLANLKKRFDDGPVDWTAWLAQLEKTKSAPPASSPTPPTTSAPSESGKK